MRTPMKEVRSCSFQPFDHLFQTCLLRFDILHNLDNVFLQVTIGSNLCYFDENSFKNGRNGPACQGCKPDKNTENNEAQKPIRKIHLSSRCLVGSVMRII